MDTTVSLEALVSKLTSVFCSENKAERKYARVWLTDVDFGGLYTDDKFVLNIQAEHEIDSCIEETRHIAHVLFKEIPTELRRYIMQIKVYNAYDEIHCWTDEIEVPLAETC